MKPKKKLIFKSGIMLADGIKLYKYTHECMLLPDHNGYDKVKEYMLSNFDVSEHCFFLEVTEEWVQ